MGRCITEDKGIDEKTDLYIWKGMWNQSFLCYNPYMSKKIEKNEKGVIKISVRDLVEFILREGDIDNRHGRGASAEAMLAGGRIHRKIQKRMGSNYHAEVPLKIAIEEDEYQLVIEGRADGILIESAEEEITFADNFNHMTMPEDCKVTIDEIKGMYMKLDLLDDAVGVHRAQAMCYAYIYALQHDLATISVQMTYCNLDTEDIRYFHYDYTFEELGVWFEKLITEYKKWADFQFAWKKLRQASIKPLQFPFSYLASEKELELVEACRKADMGFIVGATDNPEFVCNLAFSDKICLVASEDYRCPDSITLSELKKFTLVMLNEQFSSYRLLHQYLKQAGHPLDTLRVMYHLDSTESVKSTVLAGHGAAFLPYITVKKEVYQKQIKIISVMDFDLNYDVYSIYNPHLVKNNPALEKIILYFISIVTKSIC